MAYSDLGRRLLLRAIAAMAVAGSFAWAAAPTISGVTVNRITTTSAEVAWTTDAPATTQVVLMDLEYQPARRFPEPADPALSTTHLVRLTNLIPGTKYEYYVASADSEGGLGTTFDQNHPAAFTTLAIDPQGAFEYRLDPVGARNFYAGHDLYVQVDVHSLGSDLGHLYLTDVSGLPAGVAVHLLCGLAGHGGADESRDSSFDQQRGLHYCYLNPKQYTTNFVLRLRANADAAPGSYAADFTFESKGVTKVVHWAFSVLPPPAAPKKRPIYTIPPIPNLKAWEQTMVYLGKKWCNPSETMAWGYEAQIWYYDGGRTFLQLADYTRDPDTWYPCAMNILDQYRDRVISRNGYYEGWRVFPHGLAMKYWRTGDEEARRAVALLATASAFALSGGKVSSGGMRETAYILEAYVKAEEVGEPRNQYLARAVDLALGQFDQVFVSDPHGPNQIGMDGLLAEALIQYYELTGDPRVPVAIKTMLDGIWEDGYDPATHAFAYNSLLVPPKYVNVQSNLIIPAYAWYWRLTGDPVYLERGDDLFAHALDQDISYSGKIFNQNYRWSFDYVRWRSGEPLSTTSPAANTPEYVARAQNHPPVVSAGVNRTLAWPARSVALAGTASDADGTPLTYRWTELSGPGTVTFSAPASLTTNAAFSAPGAYVLQLTATDNYKSSSASVEVTVGHEWYRSAWQYRKRITVDHSQVSAPLAGFPLLVSVAATDLRPLTSGGKVATADGRDLVFTDGANRRVPFEIESYDAGSGRLAAWVKCDLSTTADTTLYLYFGNSSAPRNQNARRVWDGAYQGVWHLSDSSGTSWLDSTGHATSYSPEPPRAASGVIGGAQEFTGKEYIAIPAGAAWRLGNDLTFEAWVNSASMIASNARVLMSQESGPGEFPPSVQLTGRLEVQTWIPSRGMVASTVEGVFTTGHWYHIAYVRDGMGASSRFYVNGVPVELRFNAGAANYNFAPATGLAYLGRQATGYNWQGRLDEVRISNVARPAAWIATEYANERPESTLVRAGALETAPAGQRPLPPPRYRPGRN